MPIYLRIMKNRCYPLLIIIFLVLVSVAYALGGYIENTPYKDADALRDTLKAKGLSDAEVDQAFLKYVNAGYNLKDVKVAVEAKYAIESLTDVEKIAYLQEHFSSSVSHLKNDYGFADADILKLSDQGVPLKSVYGKLTRIAEDPAMGKDVARWTAGAIRMGAIKADEVSLFNSAQVIKAFKEAVKTNPLSTGAGENQIIKVLKDENGYVIVLSQGEGESIDGITLLVKGDDTYGWQHIVIRHMQGVPTPTVGKFPYTFSEVLGGKTTEEQYKIVQQWIQDSLKTVPTKSGNRYSYTYAPLGDGKSITTIVDLIERNVGGKTIKSYKVITSFPVVV